MSKILAALIFLFLTVNNAAAMQTIFIDDKHIQMGLPEGQEGEYYTIKPAVEIELDATGYQFPYFDKLENRSPNAIQLVIGNDRQYTVFWKRDISKYVLNNATLIPRFKDFDGFNAGDQFIIAIGQLTTDYEKKKQVFKVQWVGMGRVEP